MGARTGCARVQVRDPPDVVLGFGESWDPGTAGNGARARVVSGQAQLHVATIALEQFLQVADARVHVLLWVKGIGHLQLPGRRRHELHQPHGSLA